MVLVLVVLSSPSRLRFLLMGTGCVSRITAGMVGVVGECQDIDAEGRRRRVGAAQKVRQSDYGVGM
jgi:hypothetical protein